MLLEMRRQPSVSSGPVMPPIIEDNPDLDYVIPQGTNVWLITW